MMTPESIVEWAASWVPDDPPGQRERFIDGLRLELDALRAELASYKLASESWDACRKENESLRAELAECRAELSAAEQIAEERRDRAKAAEARAERYKEALVAALPVMAQCAIHVGYVTHEAGGQAAITEISQKWPPCQTCESARDHYEHCKMVCEHIDAALAETAPKTMCERLTNMARGRDASGINEDELPDDAERAARDFWRWFQTSPHEDCRDTDCTAKLAALLRTRDAQAREAGWNEAVEAAYEDLHDNCMHTACAVVRALKRPDRAKGGA